MIFAGLLKEALISVSASRLRTFLAVLGIVIGVASVVLMLAIGTGSQRAIEESIRKLGSNLLIITAENPTGKAATNINNYNFLTEEVANVLSVLPSVVATSAVSSSFEKQIVVGKLNWSTRIIGVSNEYFYIRDWKLMDGSVFTPDDVRLGKRVAVIGSTVAEKLFPGVTATGGTMRINGMPFQVIGVLASKGQDFSGRNQDDIVYMPIATVKSKVVGYTLLNTIQMIFVKVVSSDAMEIAAQQITEALRKEHKLRGNQPDDFSIHNLTSITKTATDTTKALSTLLGAIASISLIVGGIGVMNIMLVTVAERTREIGIRKAIGASSKNILLQFLMEAVLIAVSGSMIGLIIGCGLGIAAGDWLAVPVAYSLWFVVAAIAVAVLVGIVSGIYPAYKAAKMQPIDALRTVGA